MNEQQQPVLKKEILLEQYLKTLNDKELKAYKIAEEHLGTSFKLEKSVGYVKWKKDYLLANNTL